MRKLLAAAFVLALLLAAFLLWPKGAPQETQRSTQAQPVKRQHSQPVEQASVQRGSISGRVLTAAGTAAAGAEVRAKDAIALAGKLGEFALDVAPGEYEVVARLQGAKASARARVGAGETATVSLHLDGNARFEGVVTHAGAGIANAYVEARAGAAVAASANADAAGRYVLGPLAPGIYEVVADTPGYMLGEKRAGLEIDQRAIVSFDLEQSAFVEGVVTDDKGEPFAGATVSAAEEREQTVDSSGHYRVEVRVPSDVIVAEAGGDKRVARVEIKPGGVFTYDFHFTRRVQSDLAVAAVFADGSPGAGATIDGGDAPVTADADGKATLHVVAYQRMLVAKLQGREGRVRVDPPPGEKASVKIVLDREPQELPPITGIVVDANGAPVPGAKLQRSRWYPTAESGADGRFELKSIDANPVKVFTQVGTRYAEREAVNPGDEITLTLHASASVSGRVTNAGAEGFDLQIDRPGSDRSWIHYQGDAFTLRDLEPGLALINARDATRVATASIDLAPGEAKAIELTLAGKIALTGRIVDGAIGKPIARARVDCASCDSRGNSGDDGVFHVDAAPGPQSLTVSADRFFAQRELEIDVSATSANLGNIALDRIPIGGIGIVWAQQEEPIASAITPGGPADRAGIQAGDRIFSVNGARVTDRGDATNLVNSLPVGTVVQIVFLRDGQPISTQLQLVDLYALTNPN